MRIQALITLSITDVLARTYPDASIGWGARLNQVVYTKNSEKMIQEICQIVRRNNLDLYIVSIPESPWLEQQYPAWVKERYKELLDLFRADAKGIFIFSAEDAGLGNRHFLNRFLKSDFDYSKWSDPNQVVSPDFDPDHMNPVGAARFTPYAAKAILDAMH